MAQNQVKYGYALINDTGKVVGIDSLRGKNQYNYHFNCPHCHDEMYPTFGRIQAHHFRHKGKTCQHQRYLHSLAEQVFIQEFQTCRNTGLPFILEIHRKVLCNRHCVSNYDGCCEANLENTIYVDLAGMYVDAQLEATVFCSESTRRPDVLLKTEEGDQLWIEFWVTHETDEEKKKEGNILEIKIFSEEDINQFRNHKIIITKGNDDSVRLFNIDYEQPSPFARREYVDLINCTEYKEFKPRIEPRKEAVNLQIIRQKAIKIPSKDPEPFRLDEYKEEWVDLGLPSGTLWASSNQRGAVLFVPARSRYGQYLPSKAQVMELFNECVVNKESGIMVLTGPNGNTITFDVNERCSTYWLDAYEDKDRMFGQCLRLFRDGRHLINDADIGRQSFVRLCKSGIF